MKKHLSGVWIVILTLIAVDAAGLHLRNCAVALPGILAVAGSAGFLFLLSLIYTYPRPDHRLAQLTMRGAQLLGFSTALGIFDYLGATLRHPLIDAQLDAADKAVGFDWLAFYTWVNAHDDIQTILIWSYNSVVVQIGLLTTLLISLRRFDRARSLIWLYMATSLCYVIVAAFFPAAGGFVHYGVGLQVPYVRQFLALRDGSMILFDPVKMQGVVQFPSFHLTLAVLCAYSMRGIRFWFWPILILNILVIVATPAIGGHYLADLWSSAILTVLLIWLIEHCLKRHNSTITGT